MAARGDIWILVNIDDQFPREFLKEIIRQQKDMDIVEFASDGTEATFWTIVDKVCTEHNGADERVVVIESFQASEEHAYRDRCSVWLMDFPGVIVIAIDWMHPKVIVLTLEVRCDEAAHSLQDLINAIRHAPIESTPDEEPSKW